MLSNANTGYCQPEAIHNSEFTIQNYETPALVQLFTSRVPENAREATASMVFAPLASYLSNTVTIRDVSNKLRNLQFTSIVVGNAADSRMPPRGQPSRPGKTARSRPPRAKRHPSSPSYPSTCSRAT